MSVEPGQPEQQPSVVTILDVLEGFFGGLPDESAIRSLTKAQVEELGELVLESASVAAGQAAPESTYYPGGWLAGNWFQQFTRGDLNLALLYYPRLLVHDPLAEFFFRDWSSVPRTRELRGELNRLSTSAGPELWTSYQTYSAMSGNLDRVHEYLAQLIKYVVDLSPLIRSSVLVLRAQWPTILARADAIMTSVRSDVRTTAMRESAAAAAGAGTPLPLWDNVWGMNVTPGDGLRESDEPWRYQNSFFYLAKTLAVADAAAATFVPPTESELAALRVKAADVGRRVNEGRQPVDLLAEVRRLLLPDLQLDVRTAVDMRLSEVAFDDWRRTLRKLARAGHADSMEELRERVDDELTPVLIRVRNATDRSQTMRRALKEQSVTTVITSGATAATAAATLGNPIASAIAGLGGGALQWIWKAYRPPALGGADAVIASLIRRR